MEINGSQEIDLWQLLVKVFKFTRRRIRIILLFFLAGLLFSVSNFFTRPLDYASFYKKELLASSSVASNDVLYDIINGIPPARINVAGSKSVKAKLEANINKETRLKVMAEAYEPRAIDSMLASVTAYINAIPELSERYELQKQQHKQLAGELERQLSDSAWKSSAHMDHMEKRLEMLQQRSKAEKELALAAIVEFIPIDPEPVMVSNRRAAILNVLGYSFLGTLIGFLAGFLLGLIRK
ncbi:MAG: hypothetical protein AB1458_13130 [Bacteroidota bacterium]